MLADGRQHLVSDPTLKFLGFWLAATHNQLVQARLTDEDRRFTSVLSNVRIADIGDFVFIEVFAQVVSACPKDVAHILT